MPTRVLREGIITSEAVNALSPGAEIFYRRLMSVVDDYGRYFAHQSLLRAACYPLQLDRVSECDVSGYLRECVTANLIRLYGNGKYVLLINFNQQTRSKSKFPEPTANELLIKCTADVKQMTSLDEGVVEGEGVVGDVVEGEGDTSPVEAELPLSPKEKQPEEISPDRPILPPEAEFWNANCGKLAKVLSFGTDRATHLRARRKDSFWVANFERAVRFAASSEFCNGGGAQGWRADFDWLLRPGTVAKIMEGKYAESKSKSKKPF